jgi:hypothetical protein
VAREDSSKRVCGHDSDDVVNETAIVVPTVKRPRRARVKGAAQAKVSGVEAALGYDATCTATPMPIATPTEPLPLMDDVSGKAPTPTPTEPLSLMDVSGSAPTPAEPLPLMGDIFGESTGVLASEEGFGFGGVA